MGWFDDQIKTRIKSDTNVFEESLVGLTDAVVGENQARVMYDKRVLTRTAIEDILKYYRLKIKDIPESITDVNDQLEWMLRPHGVMRRSVYLKEGWYNDAVGPMLAFTKEGEKAVALIPGKLYGYYYTDPDTGKRVRVNKTNAKLFETYGICFYTPLPLKPIGFMEFIKFILGQLSFSDIATMVISTLLVTAFGMILPQLNRILFSDVVGSESIKVLLSMALFIVCASVTNVLFTTVKTLVTEKIRTKININMQAAGMMRILSLPADFFKDYGSGELSQRVSYLNSLTGTVFDTVFSTGLTGVFSLSYIAQIFNFAPALVVPAIIITLITVAFSVVSSLVQMSYSTKQMESTAKTSSLVYSIITGIKKIKLAGAEKRMFSRWAGLFAKEAELTYNPPTFLKINSVISMAIGLIGTLVMYSVALANNVSLPDYLAFNTSYGMLSAAFMQVSSIALTVATIRPILKMIEPILKTTPEVSEGKEVIENISGGIELQNVSFKYGENLPNVIDNLSLNITPGQYVAICGTTGCGKTTLMRLLLGFERPQRGGIFYDGKNINNVDIRSLRHNIGCVMQNGGLFQGDIYSNIVISAPWLTVDEAWAAAELAGIADDIRNMPMGMYTVIQEGSGGISGGQKQRLMIARAIAPNPRILLFDEATSALDNITQKKVSESLDSLKCTRIVVAHRLSTIKQCDRIIVLEKGHIIEDGTYEELLAKGGAFAQLVERQKVG